MVQQLDRQKRIDLKRDERTGRASGRAVIMMANTATNESSNPVWNSSWVS